MNILITDINSDRVNIQRHIDTIFKNSCIISKLREYNSLYNDYQKFSSRYKKQLQLLLKVINSNNDYRINEVNTQLNEVISYFNGASNVLKISTSDLVIKDILKVLIQFIETKYSDLLKIKIV